MNQSSDPNPYSENLIREYGAIRKAFLTRLRGEIPVLRTSLQEQDYVKAKEICHDIKGTSGMCGFFKIFHKCKELEEIIVGLKTGDVESLLDSIEDTSKKVEAEPIPNSTLEKILGISL